MLSSRPCLNSGILKVTTRYEQQVFPIMQARVHDKTFHVHVWIYSVYLYETKFPRKITIFIQSQFHTILFIADVSRSVRINSVNSVQKKILENTSSFLHLPYNLLTFPGLTIAPCTNNTITQFSFETRPKGCQAIKKANYNTKKDL